MFLGCSVMFGHVSLWYNDVQGRATSPSSRSLAAQQVMQRPGPWLSTLALLPVGILLPSEPQFQCHSVWLSSHDLFGQVPQHVSWPGLLIRGKDFIISADGPGAATSLGNRRAPGPEVFWEDSSGKSFVMKGILRLWVFSAKLTKASLCWYK